eukprot:689394_1
MAALAHGWSQIWLLQLWSVFLAYHVESITDCDNISARYSSTIGLFSVLTIGVWVATFVYVDSPPMVTKGWMFSSLISGWLFVLFTLGLLSLIAKCQMRMRVKSCGIVSFLQYFLVVLPELLMFLSIVVVASAKRISIPV